MSRREETAKYIGMLEGLVDIREFYASIDVFVLPSLLEGMPISLIEAQAGGRPIVASRLGGIELSTAPEMRNNLFPVNDVEAPAKCIIDLLRNPEKRIAQGRAGQKFVKRNLDIKIAVRKFEKLYLTKEDREK